MRAIGCDRFGGPSVLRLLELPEPHAGLGEVRVRVRSVPVNPADIMVRSGGAQSAVSGPPYLPGIEASGVLDETGPGVRAELPYGSHVIVMVNPTRPAGGSYAEYLVVPETWVSLAPRSVPLEHASTVAAAGLTARASLDALGLPPGASLLVSGGAGVVGGYTLQLARADGVRTIADAAPSDRSLVRSLGADLVLERGTGLAASVRRHQPSGVDAVVDSAVIGAPLVSAVRDGGAFVVLRQTASTKAICAAADARRITVHKVIVNDRDGDTAALDRLSRQVDQGLLTPRVAEILPAAAGATAHKRFERGGLRGRLVLTF